MNYVGIGRRVRYPLQVMRGATPRELGFRAPPEWDPHEATWTSWPFGEDLWEGFLEGARREFTQLVAAIARFEPVWLNVPDAAAEADARRRLAHAEADLDAVRFHTVALDDIWFRDNGPIFVRRPSGQVALVDWDFNGWGGKYPHERDRLAPGAVAERLGMRRFCVPHVLEGGAIDVSGRGDCLTTRSCLLSPTRNPGLTQEAYERLLGDNLGVRRVIWLAGGLEDDDTDGHVDNVARFVADDTIVCSVEEDEDDPNYPVTRSNLEQLRAFEGADDASYRIVELPLPEKVVRLGGKRLTLSYANFYIGNGFVLVPLYDDVNDQTALDILRPLFPGRRVTGLQASALATGGGGFHCVTQQQPEGVVYAR